MPSAHMPEKQKEKKQTSPEPSPDQRFPKPSPGPSLQPSPEPPRPSPGTFCVPSPERCWTWPASAPKLPRHSPEPSSPEPFPEPSPEPCWTWPPRTFFVTLLNLTWLCTKAAPKSAPEPCWTWPGSAPKIPKTFSGTFGTFSGTSLNLPGACTSAHRSYSGLKILLAYAVGEKCSKIPKIMGDMSYHLSMLANRITPLKILWFCVVTIPIALEWNIALANPSASDMIPNLASSSDFWGSDLAKSLRFRLSWVTEET